MWICDGPGLEIGVGGETNELTNGKHRGKDVIPIAAKRKRPIHVVFTHPRGRG